MFYFREVIQDSFPMAYQERLDQHVKERGVIQLFDQIMHDKLQKGGNVQQNEAEKDAANAIAKFGLLRIVYYCFVSMLR